MKRIVALLMAVCMMISLVACGNQAADKYCTHCGKGMARSDSFCPECGTAVGGEISTSSTDGTSETTTKSPNVDTSTPPKPTTTIKPTATNKGGANSNNSPKEMKTIQLNEMVTINTERGTFKMAVCGAVIKKEKDHMNWVGILCKLVNVDFKGKYEDRLHAYELVHNYHFVEILDEEGFAVAELSGMTASPLLGYAIGDDILMGGQAKTAIVVEAEKSVKNFTVVINKEYQIVVSLK